MLLAAPIAARAGPAPTSTTQIASIRRGFIAPSQIRPTSLVSKRDHTRGFESHQRDTKSPIPQSKGANGHGKGPVRKIDGCGVISKIACVFRNVGTNERIRRGWIERTGHSVLHRGEVVSWTEEVFDPQNSGYYACNDHETNRRSIRQLLASERDYKISY